MITDLLAQRVMGWTRCPGRYLMENRRWIPDWRFQPLKNLEAALDLLSAAKPEFYTIEFRRRGLFTVRVQVGDIVGVATESSQALAVSYAVARAIGIDPESPNTVKTAADLS